MTDNLNLFVDNSQVNESDNRKIIVGGEQLIIRKKRTIIFRSTNARLKNVFYVFKLDANLIIVFKLCSLDHIGQFDAIIMTIFYKDDFKKIVFRVGKMRNDKLYQITEIVQESFEFVAFADDKLSDTEVVKV